MAGDTLSSNPPITNHVQPTSSFVVEQYVNSYFLHFSDGTSLVLVFDPLTESNYTTWSQAMLLGLTFKNKVGFIDRTLLCPTGDLWNSWIICNSVVTVWIFNSLSKEISANINFSDYAREIWLDLEQCYQRKNRPQVFQLRRDISNLTQEQNPVTTYFAKLKTLWNELVSYRSSCTCGRCSCGVVKKLAGYFQTEYVMAFLMASMNLSNRFVLSFYFSFGEIFA